MDIYTQELDDETRNAPRVRVIHHPAPAVVRRPSAAYYAGQPVPAPTYYPQPAPAYYPQPSPGYAPQPVIVQRTRRFADMPMGEVLGLAAQAFAALQPLPAAPTALGKADDDVQNLIVYQSALATHAKRDEQLRTLGSLVAKLLS